MVKVFAVPVCADFLVDTLIVAIAALRWIAWALRQQIGRAAVARDDVVIAVRGRSQNQQIARQAVVSRISVCGTAEGLARGAFGVCRARDGLHARIPIYVVASVAFAHQWVRRVGVRVRWARSRAHRCEKGAAGAS